MWRTAVNWNDGETGDLLHIYWNESVNINHLLTKLCHVWNNFPRNGQKTHMAAMSKNKEVNGFCLHFSWTHTSLSTAELAIAPKTANVSYLAFFFSLFFHLAFLTWPCTAESCLPTSKANFSAGLSYECIHFLFQLWRIFSQVRHFFTDCETRRLVIQKGTLLLTLKTDT